ncbi:MAG: ribonuclease HII [Sulfolobales archaeon]
MLVLGIDEAGRGPLIGDMFVAAVALYESSLDTLTEAGVDDSKKLSPKSRVRLFNTIITYSQYIFVKRFPPEVIDLINISSLFIEAITSAVKTAHNLGLDLSMIYVDSTSNRQKIINSLKELVRGNTAVVVEYKADEKYTAVAAASIVAKVLRDSHISYLRSIYGDFGSGYPSDPRTVKWVENYLASYKTLPPIVRRSWKTIKRLGRHQKSLEDFM